MFSSGKAGSLLIHRGKNAENTNCECSIQNENDGCVACPSKIDIVEGALCINLFLSLGFKTDELFFILLPFPAFLQDDEQSKED